MKAVRIHEFGGPEVLRVEDLPTPEPGEGEVLVRVSAASVNPVDYKIRSGSYPKAGPDQLPIALGRDVCGTVERLGPGVASLEPGDVVYAMLPQGRGGYAEYVALPAEICARKPETIDAIAAASVPLAALTAWQGLFDHGGLKDGQHVLIHGASGGVGHFAVQLAVAKGARVTATARGEDRVFLEGLGAERVVDYKSERFEDVVRNVNVVFDLVAGETQDRSWAVLKEGGAMVSTLAAPSKEKAADRHAHAAHFMAHPDGGQLAEVARLIDEGKVRPAVEKVYPLEGAAEAERYLENEHVQGKVVLKAA